MASFKLYQRLGLSRTDATAEEVKRAYKRLSLRHHPDRNLNDPSAVGRFQELVLAYEVLGCARKRQIYDSYGEQGLRLYESYMAFAEAGGDTESGKLPLQPVSMLALLCCVVSLGVLLITATCVALLARLSRSTEAPLVLVLLPLWILIVCSACCMYAWLHGGGVALWLLRNVFPSSARPISASPSVRPQVHCIGGRARPARATRRRRPTPVVCHGVPCAALHESRRGAEPALHARLLPALRGRGLGIVPVAPAPASQCV